MNQIYSFKNREIDLDKPIYVYRNLHKTGVWYSMRQGSLVRAHATELELFDCNFKVNEVSRQKVVRTGDKFPHAYIIGYVRPEREAEKTELRIFYNPKTVDDFILPDLNMRLAAAETVVCDETGVWLGIGRFEFKA